MDSSFAVKALGALGEANRLAIFRALVAAGPAGMVVGAIAEQLTIAPATLSFHLKTLLHAGLVTSARERQFVRYAANFEVMNALLGYLTDHCCAGHPELCTPDALNAERSCCAA